MRDGGRVAAALAVLADIEERHRPAHLALKAWGAAARYAGAKDRAFVSGLALDSLRRRRSLAWRMAGAKTARGVIFACLRFAWDWPVARIAEAAGDEHGAGALSIDEARLLAQQVPLKTAPASVCGDYPDWLEPAFLRAFGDDRAAEGEALAQRAPVDLRCNTLKTDVDRLARHLAAFSPQRIVARADALRIAAPHPGERTAPVEATPAFEKGWFEVQDLGSQVCAALAGDIARSQVLDYCAGGGGKTLALAAAMGGTGQLWAYDADARPLAQTVKRARRAGVRNLQVVSPIDASPLAGLEGRMDVVFVDAPCTGSGTWRRRPDAKWRLTPEQLARRVAEQDAILASAARFARPGGRMIYVTCSVIPEENEDRIHAFLGAHAGFALTSELRLTPRTTATDGFYAAVLARTER